jgi:Uma2 family endonuclease
MAVETRPAWSVASAEVPPMAAGDHLTRAEFRRRYSLHPEIGKAELIDGVVFVPSPVRLDEHADPHAALAGWLVAYAAATPGTRPSIDATTALGEDTDVQPDISLRLDKSAGGRTRRTADGYLTGGPELVVEVAASSASYDLYEKRRAYAAAGVQEYVVALGYERRVLWYTLAADDLVARDPDADGVFRSAVFPGLWLLPGALWSGDLPGLLVTLQAGLASDGHAAFVAALRQRREP